MTGIVGATAGYAMALADFDGRYALGIMGGGHDDLIASAAPATIAYKPCGAGGGDIGIVLGTDPKEVDAFVASAGELGCRRVPAGFERSGLAVSGVPL